jgi:hypothetical protein
VGFLDDLKRQAESLKTQQTIDIAALARNAGAVEAACKTTWHYWMDLAPQLNVLLPRPPVRLLPDHDQGTVAFKASNLDSLETVTVSFAAELVNADLLDQLARWLVGEPHTFLKLGTDTRRQEA